MDPAGLLLSINKVSDKLDELSQNHSSASDTLTLIRAQVKTLQAGTQRIQEWLHFTEPTERAQITRSVQDAVATVRSSLERLQDGVASSQYGGVDAAKVLDDGRNGESTLIYNEARMRKYLVDLRECASLMQFTLNVCQQPIGAATPHGPEELSKAAIALRQAQTSPRRERRSVIERAGSEGVEASTADYENFMHSVMAAEEDLTDESLLSSRPGSSDSLDALGSGSGHSMKPTSTTAYEGGNNNDHPTVTLNGYAVDDVPPIIPFKDPLVSVPTGSDASSLTVRPSADRLPSWSSSDGQLINDINNILGTASISLDNKELYKGASPPPNIPTRSPQRQENHPISVARDRGFSLGSIRRKPVSATWSSSDPSGDSKQPLPAGCGPSRRNTDLTSSASSSALSIARKMTPLTNTLRSLSPDDFVNIELEQATVQPYVDSPPAYAGPAWAAGPRTARVTQPRRNTGRSSLVRHSTLSTMTQLARESRLDEIRAALKDGYNVNELDASTGTTPIMESARYRRWDACRLLIESGARVHLKDSDGNTALHHAARVGDSEICQVLLDAGAPSEDCNKDGKQAIQLAVEGGHTETVLTLVNSIPYRKPNDEALVNAWLSAIKLGDTPTAQALLAKGVKPKRLKDSWRMAGYAAQSGSIPMLEHVLAQKASLKERSPLGYSPLHFAALHGHQPMVERLLALKVPWKATTKKTEETALHIAAAAGHTGTALALVAHKDANVTVEDADDQQPVHHAVRKGDARLLATLLQHGAKLKDANEYGWKPIHLAAAYGHVNLLAECITRATNIEEKLTTPSFKPEKRTNQAARRGYWAEIRWPHAGSRPLHLALEFGHVDVAHLLISSGAKLDEPDSRGWRPLHMAAWSCLPDMVDLLLQKGVTVDARTVDGHTALTLGYREYGIIQNQAARARIHDTLSIALARQKRSMIKQLTTKSPSSVESKTGHQRNLAWHTAQLAEQLYQPEDLREGEDDGDMDDFSDSLEGSEIGVAVSADDALELYSAQAGASWVAR
ncbi:hypothetical protein LTR62_002015 [Meristemomyces frigidus]|uniref:Ankyrin repeat protein n=1 Tax=Meristemomyces frigidus TaxID=1508187 RepID=A0AAN7YLF7_9PEZI|nr:hypothetical protein LTR62_002015 [Meristemomyces frigidus]